MHLKVWSPTRLNRRRLSITRRAQKAFERDMERGRKKAKEEALVSGGSGGGSGGEGGGGGEWGGMNDSVQHDHTLLCLW